METYVIRQNVLKLQEQIRALSKQGKRATLKTNGSSNTTRSKSYNKLEQKTGEYEGRKVLYSRSYYTEEAFWQIYDRQAYLTLREKTKAEGIWPDITEKVLSE